MTIRVLRIRNCRILSKRGTRLVDLAIKDGRILSIRSSSPDDKPRSGDYEADGKVVLPGMIDCHAHLFSLAMQSETIQLLGSRSLVEMQKRISNKLSRRRSNPDKWILGRGWDQEAFEENKMPERADIDKCVPDRPAIMVRVCGHIAILNSPATELLSGVLSRFGSELVPRDQSGTPTGVVKESALEACWEEIPGPSVAKLCSLFRLVQTRCISYGLTGVHCILSNAWKRELLCIRKLDREGRLLIKLSVLLPIAALNFVEKQSQKSIEHFRSGRRFLVTGFKLYCDGSLGARTAALEFPYSDDKENRGMLNYSTDAITGYARRAKRLKMILASHAIGDRAVEQVLDAYERAGIRTKDGFRIEHCSVLRKSLLSRLKIATICIQPMFCLSDTWIADRIGTGRGRFAYLFKTLARNAHVIAGSDAPVESLDPFTGLIAASKNNDHLERLSLSECLDLYTKNAANASWLTRECGELAPGKDCDLVILDSKDPKAFTKAKVYDTFVDGDKMKIAISSNMRN